MSSIKISMFKISSTCSIAKEWFKCRIEELVVIENKEMKTDLVTRKTIDGKIVFICDICGLGYSDKETAQKCEDWCGKNSGTCNFQISQKAVYAPGLSFSRKKSS